MSWLTSGLPATPIKGSIVSQRLALLLAGFRRPAGGGIPQHAPTFPGQQVDRRWKLAGPRSHGPTSRRRAKERCQCPQRSCREGQVPTREEIHHQGLRTSRNPRTMSHR
ncbi:hypothetical protein AGOR_G00041370 [Albula goreensis]|uniref:Uncharacterized protein n=1 Tax=Albula goreensis TaxID=1534307 RepID=A0A8T3DYE6_9TELE|nr:hypothetical protein AGOR_G00041370 [Albula goreensis]